MVLSGRGGEGRVEKNGGGTWSVTNDNSYTFLNLFNYKRKKQNKIRKKIQLQKRHYLRHNSCANYSDTL